VAGDTDNARRGNGTLDMPASLMGWMVTLCLTDPGARYGCPASLRVASMGRETHMRTYQKQADAVDDVSSPCNSLPIPCGHPGIRSQSIDF